MSKVVSAQIPDALYKKLQEYRQKYAISSDSEAVRDILRKFLFGNGGNSNGKT